MTGVVGQPWRFVEQFRDGGGSPGLFIGDWHCCLLLYDKAEDAVSTCGDASLDFLFLEPANPSDGRHPEGSSAFLVAEPWLGASDIGTF